MSTLFKGESLAVVGISRRVRSVRQDYEIVVRPKVVVCVPITPDEQVVLVRQYRTSIDTTILELPAGHISEGEDAQEAARRELLEEVGFVANQIVPIGMLLTAPHFSNEQMSVFLAMGDTVAVPDPTPKEDLHEVVKMTPLTLGESIAAGKIVDSKTIAAFAIAQVQACKLGVSL